MKKTAIIILLVSFMVVCTGNAVAKDLQRRLGVGFNSQLSIGEFDVDSISVKYAPRPKLCLQGMFGFAMSDPVDIINFGGKVLFNIKEEQNMNVYAGGGIGIASIDPDTGDSDTAFSLSGILGVEYFFSGLPNLGFSTELGLVFLDYDEFDAVGTMADSFMSAGIHYYF
ncbi:MAG: hypothetical protein ACMUIL_05405 [bacterium]